MVFQFLLALSIRFFLFDFVLFKKIREALKKKGYFFRKLLGCPFCQGFWTGLAIYLYFNFNTFRLCWPELINLLSFGFISAYLGLATAVYLNPLIQKYEQGSGIPLQ